MEPAEQRRLREAVLRTARQTKAAAQRRRRFSRELRAGAGTTQLPPSAAPAEPERRPAA
jgi:hypothetical protein